MTYHARRVRNVIEWICIALALGVWFLVCAVTSWRLGDLLAVTIGVWIFARVPIALAVVIWESLHPQAAHRPRGRLTR